MPAAQLPVGTWGAIALVGLRAAEILVDRAAPRPAGPICTPRFEECDRPVLQDLQLPLALCEATLAGVRSCPVAEVTPAVPERPPVFASPISAEQALCIFLGSLVGVVPAALKFLGGLCRCCRRDAYPEAVPSRRARMRMAGAIS